MITTLHYPGNELTHQNVDQPKWQRIAMLIILGYEGAGCLLGGSLLIIAPDGRLMEMPVSMMHDVFPNFLIPGFILFALGVLNTGAFVSVLRKSPADWFFASLGLGGLVIWFIVEIIILQELHWLHLMWGYPVLVGCVLAIPLGVFKHNTTAVECALLTCGILSSLWYVAINIFVPLQWEDYSISTQTVSELSALGSPTRRLWTLLVMPYPLLFAAFGWGIREAALTSRSLRVVGSLIIVYSLFNFYWPPMHMRHILAAGGGTLTDTLHIVWASVSLLFMMFLMGFAAAALDKTFRLVTGATWLVFILFGVLTFLDAPAMEANLPTPRMGIWERINIGAFMMWVMVLAVALLRMSRLRIESTRSTR